MTLIPAGADGRPRHLAEKRLRVYTSDRGAIDYEASKVELAPDGSISLTRIEQGEEYTDLQTGQKIIPQTWTLLAIIGPDGKLRAETVEVGAPLALDKP